MQRSQLLYDGLWRCLCPAFDRAGLHQAVNRKTPGLLRSLQRPAKPRRITTTGRLIQNRQYETSAPSTAESLEKDAAGLNPGIWKQRLLAPTPPSEKTLMASSVDDVVAALVALRDAQRWKLNTRDINRHERIVQLVQHLLAVQDQPLSPFIYECMMDAMADPQGSVDGVRRLLDDMTAQGMTPTATFCHDALSALTNHPDYVLRQEILDIMQERWYAIGTPAKQSLVVGLLRDEQYELAYTRFTEMIEQGARVDPWVYDIFVLVFGKLGFLNEMLLLLYRRKNVSETDPVVDSLLYFALDVCSQAYHHVGTVFAWNCVVRNSRMQPSDGIVENVLGTAARHADAQLATEALDLISGRTRAHAYHYEAVVEAFAGSGDLAAAFRILCIMKENGIRITRGHTSAIHRALKNRPELIGEAETTVRDMARRNAVPRPIVGIIVEAMARTHGSEKAMDLYRDVPTLCDGELPNASMVQDLLIHSTEAATAQALASEYADRFPEKDDPMRSSPSYSALITACAEMGQMDLAFRFAKQAMALGVTRGQLSWAKALVEQAIAREDGRIWPIVDELGRDGDDETSKSVQKMLQQTRFAKMAAKWRATSQG